MPEPGSPNIDASAARTPPAEPPVAALLNGTRDGVALTDAEGRVIYWNEGAARLFGCPSALALGQPLAERFPVALREPVRMGDWSGSFPLPPGGEAEGWVEVRLQRLGSGSGQPAGSLLLVHEVPGRHRAARPPLRNPEGFPTEVLDSMPAQVVLLDARGTLRAVNREWTRLRGDLGIPGGSIPARIDIGSNYLQACREQAGPGREEGLQAAKGLEEVLAGRRPRFELEYSCEAPGRRRWFHLHATPLGGDLRGAAVAHFDITESRLAESALVRQNRVLERIAGGAPLSDVLGEIVRLVEDRIPGAIGSIHLVDAASGSLRFAAGRSLSVEYIEAVRTVPIGPRSGSCGTAAYRAAAVQVTDIGTDPLWADYREMAMRHGLRSCLSVPVFASSGATGTDEAPRVIGTFAIYQRDPVGALPGAAGVLDVATHLAGVAIERESAQHDLRENRERFRLLVEGVRDYAIFLADTSGVVVTWNSGAERTYGYTTAEAVGVPVERFYTQEDRHAGKAAAHLARALKAGRHEFEGWLERKDQTRFWAGAVITVLEHDDGRAGGFALVVRDLTERRRLEEQLRQSQKMEAVGLLAGGVAHDFNNLLTVINGHGSMLQSDLPEGDPRRESAVAILDAGRRAAALTHQLLAFSRKAIVEPVVLDLNEVVDSISQLLRRLIGEDVRLVARLSQGVSLVRIDRSQLEQLVVNLAVNARDAMPTGGQLTLETRDVTLVEPLSADSGSVPPGRYAQLDVIDTGCGMSAEVRERAFEPFFTTKPVGQGTGMGLATVYGIVRQADGHVSMQSTPGLGTAFRIWLPATRELAVTRPAARTHSDAPRGSETILLAEDDEEVRKLVRTALSRQGYQVIESGSGREALEASDTHAGPIDLLISDVVMPDFGGPRLADAIREKRPGIRVLYISGYTEDAVLRHGVESSTDVMLPKPFTPVMLAQKVRELLDRPE